MTCACEQIDTCFLGTPKKHWEETPAQKERRLAELDQKIINILIGAVHPLPLKKIQSDCGKLATCRDDVVFALRRLQRLDAVEKYGVEVKRTHMHTLPVYYSQGSIAEQLMEREIKPSDKDARVPDPIINTYKKKRSTRINAAPPVTLQKKIRTLRDVILSLGDQGESAEVLAEVIRDLQSMQRSAA